MLCIAALLSCLLPMPAAWARNGAPLFWLGQLGGEIGLEYEDVSLANGTNASQGNTQTSMLELKLDLRGRMFIYHPRLLDINLGLGVTLANGGRDSEGVEQQATRYNLQANILRDHPYRFGISLRKNQEERVHTPTIVTTDDVRSTRFTLSLTRDTPFLPVPMAFSYGTSEQQNEQIPSSALDIPAVHGQRTTETWSARAGRRWDTIGFDSSYRGEAVNDNRDTGSVLTGSAYVAESYTFSFDGRTEWPRQLRWNLNTSRDTRTRLPERDDQGGRAEVGYQLVDVHAMTLEAIVGGNTRNTATRGRGEIDFQVTENASRYGALNYRLFKSLFTSYRQTRSEVQHPAYAQQVDTQAISLSYSKTIPEGVIQAGHTVSVAEDRVTGSATPHIDNELHTLSDFTPIVLENSNVIASSIVVTDITETIIYVAEPLPNPDYRIVQVGGETRIERISGGTIPNPGTVLVDYDFYSRQGARRDLTRGVSLSVTWRGVNPYYRVSKREETVLEAGGPEQLNPGRAITYGVTAEREIAEQIEPRLRWERVDNQYLQDPHRSTTVSLDVPVPISPLLAAGVAYSHGHVEQHATGSNTKRTATSSNVRYAQGRMRGSLAAVYSWAVTGASTQDVRTFTGKYGISYGQWLLNFDASLAHERRDATVGGGDAYESDRTTYKLGLKRSF